MRRRIGVLMVVAALVPELAASPSASGAIGLTFYYPVGVSGPLAMVMNGMVDDSIASIPTSGCRPCSGRLRAVHDEDPDRRHGRQAVERDARAEVQQREQIRR
jgi:hypothetical protein